MKNIVLILHHEWSAQSLNLILSHPKGAFNIITLPIPVSESTTSGQIRELEDILHSEELKSEDIDYLFAEANYLQPSKEWLNEELFDYCTKTFLNAKIIAVSDTEGSLRKVYNHYERVHLWDSPAVRKMDSILRTCSLDEIKPKERKKSKKPLGRRKTVPNVIMLDVADTKEGEKAEEREAFNLMGSLSAPVESHFPEFPAHDQDGSSFASPFAAQSIPFTPLYSNQEPLLPLLFEKLSLECDENLSGPSGWPSSK